MVASDERTMVSYVVRSRQALDMKKRNDVRLRFSREEHRPHAESLVRMSSGVSSASD